MEATSVAGNKSSNRRRGPRKGTPKSDQRAIEVRERHAKWVQDRLANLSYQAIADRDGVGKSTVQNAVTSWMHRIISGPVEELKAREVQALEQLLDMAMHAEDATDLERVYAVLKILERRHRLLGLDAPTKVEAKLETETVDVEQLRALLRPLGWDIVPIAIETTGEEAKSE